jgi:hypothetical protein
MLRFLDGFDHYATADLQASLKWSCTGLPTIGATSGRRSTGALVVGGAGRYLSKTLNNQQTWIVGFAIYPTSFAYATTLLAFIDGTTYQCTVGIDVNGHLVLYRGNASVALATSSNTLSLNTWNYVEVKVVISNTVGTGEIRVNGSSTGWVNATGLDNCSNSNEYASIVRLGAISAQAGAFNFDDVYVCDSTGSTNNNFLGDCRVDSYLPSGNGNSSQFVNSNGNSTDNYSFVDDTSPDGDSTYVQSATVGNKDTYDFQSMTHTPANIFGLQVVMDAKKDDEGSRSIKSVVRSGGSDHAGSDQALSTSYVAYMEIEETDPATSAAWTKSGFNAAEFGVEVAA